MARFRRCAPLGPSLLCFFLLAGSAVAGGSSKAVFEGDAALTKVSSHLLRARGLARAGRSPEQIRTLVPVLGGRSDLPEIEVRLHELTPSILERIRALGMRITGFHYRHARIVGSLEWELLDEVAAIPEVSTVHPQYGARTWAGSVTSQGDASIRADDTRTDFGVDGSGIKVGILANSFHESRGGVVTGAGCSRTLMGSLSQNSFDLPAAVTMLDNCESGAGACSFVTDEGAAMGEIIHDLAPGAEILFHSALNGEADFAQGISELQACNADVIVDDVLYFVEPMFQDGIVAQAVQAAVDAGVSYFTAAGNHATFGVDEVYLDSDPLVDDEGAPAGGRPSGADLHDFGGGDRFGSITVPGDGCGIRLVLQWNQPYSGMLGAGSSSDLDLFLCSGDSGVLNGKGEIAACDADGALAVANDSQSCGGVDPPSGDPFEILSYVNTTGSPIDVHVAVEHYCGSQTDVRFRIAAFGVNCELSDPGYVFVDGTIFDKSSIYGHRAAAGANAVGSVFYGEIDLGGDVVLPSGSIDVNPSSSGGGDLPFYFDGSGMALPGAPVTRFKPELAAPDGTNNTFFGEDSTFDLDTDPNFFGTSAAVSHAAAVAALVLDGDATLTPQEIRDLLGSTALDIETPGVDTLSGAGLIQPYNALGVAVCGLAAPAETQNLILEQILPPFPTVRLSWDPSATTTAYHVYRGTQADLSDLACYLPDVPGTNVSDDGAIPADLLVYLVTATNCGGESSLGPARANSGPCP